MKGMMLSIINVYFMGGIAQLLLCNWICEHFIPSVYDIAVIDNRLIISPDM